MALFLLIVSWVRYPLGISRLDIESQKSTYIRKVSGNFRSESLANVKSSRLSLSMDRPGEAGTTQLQLEQEVLTTHFGTARIDHSSRSTRIQNGTGNVHAINLYNSTAPRVLLGLSTNQLYSECGKESGITSRTSIATSTRPCSRGARNGRLCLDMAN